MIFMTYLEWIRNNWYNKSYDENLFDIVNDIKIEDKKSNEELEYKQDIFIYIKKLISNQIIILNYSYYWKLWFFSKYSIN